MTHVIRRRVSHSRPSRNVASSSRALIVPSRIASRAALSREMPRFPAIMAPTTITLTNVHRPRANASERRRRTLPGVMPEPRAPRAPIVHFRHPAHRVHLRRVRIRRTPSRCVRSGVWNRAIARPVPDRPASVTPIRRRRARARTRARVMPQFPAVPTPQLVRSSRAVRVVHRDVRRVRGVSHVPDVAWVVDPFPHDRV